ncbi:MAG TPA: hypothetical protein VKW08_18600 [Xanthobacteraceae bacterium]|jgi:hypothetical protein|nr:hypothetical protein [Xanthobacteraceae bacterium]
MGGQSKFYDRAAECQRLMRLSTERQARESFRQLRDLWIEFANEEGILQRMGRRPSSERSGE